MITGRRKNRNSVLVAALAVALWPAAGVAACRQALAIGLDISGSVDTSEYRLQLDGLAGALLDPDVQAAFLAIPDANVRLFVYEWGGYGTQRALVPWTDVTSAAVLRSVAQVLLTTTRQPHDPATALGIAMQFGGQALQEQRDCWRLTMDLSGDGKSNFGAFPSDVKNQPNMQDVTINALVIGADAPASTDQRSGEIAELSAYFRSNVIRGPDAFVETALEFSGFRDAMARKLLKELDTRPVGTLMGNGAQAPPDQ